MNNYLLPLVLASVFALQACNQQPQAGKDSAEAGQEPAAASLETTEQRLSYSIAYSVGSRMGADDIPLDSDAFIQGVSDALEGIEPRLTPEEMQAEMQAYQDTAMAEREAAQAALAAANEAASAAYLEENAAREDVLVTESGLQYEVIEAGDGPMPGPQDTVEVHYRGTLVDGTVFDSSYERGEPVTFGVSQVIPGWTEALQMMPVGAKWKIVVPSELAYGSGGAGQVIGPNAALVFEVELLSIPGQEESGAENEAGNSAQGGEEADSAG